MTDRHPACAALRARAECVLAGGPGTLSKAFSRYPATGPAFLDRGLGPYVWCPDGHQYLDCVAALGPVLLGHRHEAVQAAVHLHAASLASSTLSTCLEVEVAEQLCGIIPGAEQVRFAVSGADATNAAVKLARYVTGKRHVFFCGYAGGHDSYLSTTDKRGGIVLAVTSVNHQVVWRDFDRLKALMQLYGDDLAAIILEVPPEHPVYTWDDTHNALTLYADTARDCQALFILDEVVTGFRYGLSGAQSLYGIQADLATFSKAMANGYPMAAITGSRDLLSAFEGGTVFQSQTFAAHPVSLAACQATLHVLQATDALPVLRSQGDATRVGLMAQFAAAKLPATVRGNYARMVIDWRDGPDGVSAAALRTLWLQELGKRGILAGVPWFPMACWTSEIVDAVIQAVEETCAILAQVVHGGQNIEEALECPVIEDVFQRYSGPPCIL